MKTFQLKTPHLLTGEELLPGELQELLTVAATLKRERGSPAQREILAGKTLALLFEKPSLRTRLSFAVAIQELGGFVVESLSSNSKKEEPEDVARVLGGYVHGVMLRTHSHSALERMAAQSPIPIINGLSDTHHPCQIFADLLTIQEAHGALPGLRLAYIGDGNNILHSLLLLAPILGVHVHYACPPGFQPDSRVLKRARARAREGGGSITAHATPDAATRDAHALYTDVWTSMGFEAHQEEREKAFAGYQLNEATLAKAAPGAIVLHCLPMLRGKEISETLPDHPQSALFRQSENRLHIQKALLVGLLNRGI